MCHLYKQWTFFLAFYELYYLAQYPTVADMIQLYSSETQFAIGSIGIHAATVAGDNGNYTAKTTSLPDDGLFHPTEYHAAYEQYIPAQTSTTGLAINTETVGIASEFQVYHLTTAPAETVRQYDSPRAPQTTQMMHQPVFYPTADQRTTFEKATSLSAPQATWSTSSLTSSHHKHTPESTASFEADAIRVSDPNKSKSIAIISVLLVTCVIAGYILFSLRKQKKRKEGILQIQKNSHDVPPNSPSMTFEKIKEITFLNMSRSVSLFQSATRKAYKETEKTLKPGTGRNIEGQHNEFENQHAITNLKSLCFDKTKNLLCGIKQAGTTIRDASWGRLREPKKALRYSRSIRPQSYNEWWTTGDYVGEKFVVRSHNDLSFAHSGIQSPTPAILSMQQAALSSININSVSSGRGKRIDGISVSHGSSCTMHTTSTSSTSSLSGTEKSEDNSLRPHLPNISTTNLYRRDIYHVNIAFEPRCECHMALREGERVFITQVLEDGWVSQFKYFSRSIWQSFDQVHCQKLGSKSNGLAPRAFLSAWAVRRVVTSPEPEARNDHPSFYESESPGSTESIAPQRFYTLCSQPWAAECNSLEIWWALCQSM